VDQLRHGSETGFQRLALMPMQFTATAADPYERLERATAGLRAELRRQLLAADVPEMPRWETLAVTGPKEFTDLRGPRGASTRRRMRAGGRFDRWGPAAS
jgi:hypothetical protein